MKSIFIIFYFIIIFSPAAFPQNSKPIPDESSSSLGIKLGISDFHIQDKYISPYIFSGVMFSSAVSYQLKSECNTHTVQLAFSAGGVDSDLQPRNISIHAGSVSYALTFAIDSLEAAGDPLRLSIGPGFSSYVEYMTTIAEDKPTHSFFYDDSWYSIHSLNLYFNGEYTISKRQNISLSLLLPVIKLVRRPENGHYLNRHNQEIINNKLKLFTGGKLEYIWSNLLLITEITYRAPIGGSFSFTGIYRFVYASSDKPASLLSIDMYSNNFLVGIEWLF